MGAHASTIYGSLGYAVSDDAARLVGLEVAEIKGLHARFTELRACPGLDLELFGAVFHGAFAERCEAVHIARWESDAGREGCVTHPAALGVHVLGQQWERSARSRRRYREDGLQYVLIVVCMGQEARCA